MVRFGNGRAGHRPVMTGVLYCISAVIAAVCFVTADAQDVRAQQKGPCADDAARFCQGIKTGGGAVMRCLKEHESSLSPACRERVSRAERQVKGAQDACRNDAAAFCRDVQPGEGRIARCLKRHEADLSPACRSYVTQSGAAK